MWREYRIGPKGQSETFYAPDLDTAFRLARARWPWAKALMCHGAPS